MLVAHSIITDDTTALSCTCPDCGSTIVEEVFETCPDTVDLYCKECRQGFLFKLNEAGEYIYGGH